MDILKIKSEIAKQLVLQDMDYQQLADKTGYKKSTVNAFMSRTGAKSENFAKQSCKVLKIDINKL